MRILGLNEFAALPVGTVFSCYDPAIVRGLFVKGETCKNSYDNLHDFFLRPVFPQQFASDSPALTDEIGAMERWGEMDPEALFMVYDADEVLTMRQLLGGS